MMPEPAAFTVTRDQLAARAAFDAMREHGNQVHDEEDHAGPCCVAVCQCPCHKPEGARNA
jgi:hypothetical protein